jgi:hypothetical protein
VRSSAVEYTFDAAWRRERFSRRDGSPLSTEFDDAIQERLRNMLLSHLGVECLEDIPQAGEIQKESLRTLGYL